MQFSKITTATVALALITLAIGGFAAIGAAEETDDDLDVIENSTIETTNETEYVELDIEFAETFENTSTEEYELTIYEESEYNESGDEAMVIVSDSATELEPNETVNNEYNLSDTDLAEETEYRAVLEVGDEVNVASGYIAADDESIGGAQFGTDTDLAQPGFGVGVAVAAIATAGLVAKRRGDA